MIPWLRGLGTLLRLGYQPDASVGVTAASQHNRFVLAVGPTSCSKKQRELTSVDSEATIQTKWDAIRLHEALALHYQSLLESGVVKTGAELDRRLGVSRARVTQVLKRLQA